MIKHSKDKMINFSILPSCKPYEFLKLECEIQFSYFIDFFAKTFWYSRII